MIDKAYVEYVTTLVFASLDKLAEKQSNRTLSAYASQHNVGLTVDEMTKAAMNLNDGATARVIVNMLEDIQAAIGELRYADAITAKDHEQLVYDLSEELTETTDKLWQTARAKLYEGFVALAIWRIYRCATDNHHYTIPLD